AEHTLGEGPRLGHVDQDALLAIADDVENPAGGQGDDRRARGKGFGADDPEVVLGREYEAARRRQQRTEGRVVGPSGEYDVLAGHALEGSALAAFADDEQAQSHHVECTNRDVRALVRRQSSDEEAEVTAIVVRRQRNDDDRGVDEPDGARPLAVMPD